MESPNTNCKIELPKGCPSCGGELEFVNSQLFCFNSAECPAQSTKKLQHFCKVLKIKGFGEKTVEKLEITKISELINLNVDYCKSKGLGDKTSQNLVDQIQDRLEKKIYVSDFISGMSIPLVGSTLGKKLAAIRISDLTYDKIKSVGGGDKAANNILAWLNTEWTNELAPLWEQYLVTDTIKEKTERKGAVCITGKLTDFPNRAAASEHLKSLGWEVKSSVTKAVDYLICEDSSKSSSYKKAESLGIPVTSIKNLEDK